MEGRAQQLFDRLAELVDLLVEEVQVGQDRADQQRVVVFEAALNASRSAGSL